MISYVNLPWNLDILARIAAVITIKTNCPIAILKAILD